MRVYFTGQLTFFVYRVNIMYGKYALAVNALGFKAAVLIGKMYQIIFAAR